MEIVIVVGIDEETRGIGYAGKLLYYNKYDMRRFRVITTSGQNCGVLMGRKTYESIGKKLDKRINIVISTEERSGQDIIFKKTIDDGEEYARTHGCDKLFIIGGASIYKYYLDNKKYTSIEMTKFRGYSGPIDTFFPQIKYRHREKVGQLEDGTVICTLYRIENVEEENYLQLMKEIVDSGDCRDTRNSVTKSLFGKSLKFDLQKGFPLLTTKKVWFRAIFEELMWFLRGSTDVHELQKQGVHIWDGNSTRSYLDSIGLTSYQEGDVGPIYGFQWRHWNADYHNCQTDYTDQGIDQLQMCLDQLKNNPSSRRILISGWNVGQLGKMALPPCHVLYQFYVSDNKLSCQMYQRSADGFLGLPFNIASTALFTTLMAHQCDLLPGFINICLGDLHLYSTHLQVMQQQYDRLPRPFPSLTISSSKPNFITDYTLADLKISSYHPLSAIKAPMIA